MARSPRWPTRSPTSGAAQVVVLACDLPLAAPVVKRLLTLPAGAVIAADESGREQPLCSLWPTAVARAAATGLVAAGERRMSALVDAIDPQLDPATADELLNVNTPEDLERAAAVLDRTLR